MDIENEMTSDLNFLLTTDKVKNDPDLKEKIESELEKRKEKIQEERIGKRMSGSRSQFFGGILMAFLFIPLVAYVLGNVLGIDFGAIDKIFKVKDGEVIGSGFRFNLLSVWYISIPVYLYYAYRRISDTNLSNYLLVILCLPIFNLILLFWPSKKYV